MIQALTAIERVRSKGMTVKEQLTLVTGNQSVICQHCGNTMNVKVGRLVKSTTRGSYREYRGSCRHCRTIYSGALSNRVW